MHAAGSCIQGALTSRIHQLPIPLSNNVNIDGANLSGCHRSQVGTCAHPAQSGQPEGGRFKRRVLPDGLLVGKKRAVREFNLYARILLVEGTVFQPVYVGIYTEITLSKLIPAAL